MQNKIVKKKKQALKALIRNTCQWKNDEKGLYTAYAKHQRM